MLSDSASPSRRELLHARLDALLVADHSAYGETFDDMEVFFLTKGRKFFQETFQEKLQERIERTKTTSEKDGRLQTADGSVLAIAASEPNGNALCGALPVR